MNLLHLEYFQRLAYNEHLLKTAEEMHVSAPALSASLKGLEEELGVKLFDRIGRNLVLNEQGKVFLPYVNMVFDSLEQGKRAVKESEAKKASVITVSLNDGAFYSGLLAAYLRRHPGYSFQQIDGDPSESGQLLFHKKLDVMVTAVPVDNERLDHMVINRDPYVLVVSRDDPLAAYEEVSLHDLQEETFLSRSSDSYFGKCVQKLFDQHHFVPKKTMEFSYALRSRMVSRGLGVAVSTELSLPTDFYQDVRAVRIREFKAERYTVRAYWRNDRRLTEPAAEFIKFMYAHLEGRREKLVQRLIEDGTYLASQSDAHH